MTLSEEMPQTDRPLIPHLIQERGMTGRDDLAACSRGATGYEPVRWGRVAERVRHLAIGLEAWAALDAGARVAIFASTRLEWVLADFAVLTAGHVTVGIYHTNAAAEVAHCLRHAGVGVVFVDSQERLDVVTAAAASIGQPLRCVTIGFETVATNTVDLATVESQGAEKDAADPALIDRMLASLGGDQLARMIFTSGTTGPPKAAVFNHRAWLATARQSVERYPDLARREHRSVAFFSLAHVSSAMSVGTVLVVSRVIPFFDPSERDFESRLREVRPDFVAATPRFYQKIVVAGLRRIEEEQAVTRTLIRLSSRIARLLVHGAWRFPVLIPVAGAPVTLLRRTVFNRVLEPLGLDRVRRAQTGSAVLPETVSEILAIWGVDVREVYGLTETAGAVTYQQRRFPRPGSVGSSLDVADTEVVIDETEGEVRFRSPMLFSGYWQDPEASAVALRDGWFSTGDLGEWTARGDLRLIGRKNDSFSTAGGKTVNPSQIEAVLESGPRIRRALVYGSGRKYLVALLEIDGAAELAQAEIDAANSHLARVEQIKRFCVVSTAFDEVARGATSTGKIRRTAVFEHYADQIEQMYPNDEESLIARHSARGGGGS